MQAIYSTKLTLFDEFARSTCISVIPFERTNCVSIGIDKTLATKGCITGENARKIKKISAYGQPNVSEALHVVTFLSVSYLREVDAGGWGAC